MATATATTKKSQTKQARALRAKTYRGTHLRDLKGVYTWKDEKYPSITTLLKLLDKPALPRWAAKSVAEHVREFVEVRVPEGKLQWDAVQRYLTDVDELKEVPWKYAEKRRELGSTTHDITEQFALGTPINPDVFSEDVRANVVSYLDFCQTLKPVFLAAETGVINRGVGYACTLDSIMQLPSLFGEELCIVDYKNAKDVYFESCLQVNAQRVCEIVALKDGSEIPMPDCTRNLVLVFNEGGWRLFEWPVLPDAERFIYALRVLYGMKEHKAFEGLKKKYGSPEPPVVASRLFEEAN